MTEPLDISALRAKLRVYDQSLPRCTKVITRVSNHAPDYVAEEERGEWDMRLSYPCSELEGHEGQCREGRAILGWPGFKTLTALLDEVERLRDEKQRFREAYAALLQSSADLCVVCGWRFFVPDVGCQGCERARLEAEVERTEHLRSSLDTALMVERERERAVVLDYLAYRIEMSHYSDAIKEFVNARHEISEGVHHTIDYDEHLP